MRFANVGLVISSLVAVAGCSHDQPPPNAPVAGISVTETTNAPASAPPPRSDQSLNIGPNLRKACGIDDADRAPKFDFDKANLSGNDRDIAGQVATCLTTGPLKGKSVTLVGRADPRGTDQHNMKLGEERAASFKGYLMQLGVDQGRIQDTSRGSRDAEGSTEESWRKDRRVDVELSQ